jgi:Histidine kinase-, DNA gyrase B-, and HSP90-like ATPase
VTVMSISYAHINNARDAMPSGGRLTIETRNVELDDAFAEAHPGARPGPHVALTARDTGVGMDELTLAQIFEPFFTTKDVGKGTGLGLATVSGIVKQHDGYIAVDSRRGEGTTFTVYLRHHEGKVVTPGTCATRDGPLQGSETILLVEDEDDVRDLTAEILRENGYTVLDARAGEEAEAIADRRGGMIDLLKRRTSASQAGPGSHHERMADPHLHPSDRDHRRYRCYDDGPGSRSPSICPRPSAVRVSEFKATSCGSSARRIDSW